MADRFPCEIEVGGEITKKQIKELAELMEAQGASLDWESGAPSEAEIEEAINENDFSIKDSQARYGEMEDISSYLMFEKIPFIQCSDAYCEFDAVKTVFDGEVSMGLLGSQNGDSLVSMDILKEAIELLSTKRDIEATLSLLKKHYVVDEIPKLKLAS